MLVFELAACFFNVYDCFNVAQASKECYVRSNVMFRNYVHEIRKIVDKNWLDLFLHDKIEDYEYQKICQHLLNFLNNKPYSNKISWKTFALLLNMNFCLYPRQVKKNPILRAGSQEVALKASLKQLVYQHDITMRKLSTHNASSRCMEAKLVHKLEDHILKIENISNIIHKIPRVLRVLETNLKQRVRINDKCTSVKRLCNTFSKKASVIKSLQLNLDRDSLVIERKQRIIQHLEKRLQLLSEAIAELRCFKFALIRSVHQDSINANQLFN